jgi:beta-lactam-binding protein with PASTA domain
MSRILSRDTSIIRSTEVTSGALMPNLVGMSIDRAMSLTDSLGVQTSASGTGSTVVGQWPPTSARLPASGSIELLLADRSIDGLHIPDVRNMSVREAIRILNSTGMEIELRGTGVVYGQYPVPGSNVAQSNTMVLYCRELARPSPLRRTP